jgi:hypothetical protein
VSNIIKFSANAGIGAVIAPSDESPSIQNIRVQSDEGCGLTTEIESYSDRLKPPTASGPSRLDPQILHLDESLFPPVLWKEYFEGQIGNTKKEKSRKRRKLDEGDNEEGEEMVGFTRLETE